MSENQEPNEKDLKLELVQVLFRHGARTPMQEELDVYQFNDSSAYEAWGTGQLTNVGKKLEYDIGLFLRDRYKNFLNDHYKAEEVYAYSTDICRTKMSLQLVLAGLYPPTDLTIWNPNLMWSPIPYNNVPAEFDILMKYHDFPRSLKLRSQAYQTEEFRKKVAHYSDFLAFLTEKTGLDFDENFFNIGSLYSVLVADARMGLPLPDWFKHEMTDKFRDLVGYVFDGFAFTLEMRKLGVGPLIKTFIRNMNLDGTHVNPRKIYLYSGHDCNVSLFTRSHNIEDFKYPDFGCSVILEKFRDPNNKIYVRLLGRTGTGHVMTLKLGNHKEFCPIEDYLKLVEPVIPSESEIDEMLEDVSIKKLRNLFFSDSVVTQIFNKAC